MSNTHDANIEQPKLDYYYYQHEKWNAITHGVGTIAAVVGLVVLMWLAIAEGSLERIVSFTLFGLSLIAAYGTSTLFHSTHKEKLRHWFRVADHAAIYLLIAGSYSPFALLVLGGTTGWIFFFSIWAVAIAGVVFKLFFTGKWEIISTIFYLLMGWSFVVVMDPMISNMHDNAFWLTVIGGLAYSSGVIFFLWEKLKFNHAIWHLFVMGGSISHFFAICLYV